jgi:hypothetical protein
VREATSPARGEVKQITATLPASERRAR